METRFVVLALLLLVSHSTPIHGQGLILEWLTDLKAFIDDLTNNCSGGVYTILCPIFNYNGQCKSYPAQENCPSYATPPRTCWPQRTIGDQYPFVEALDQVVGKVVNLTKSIDFLKIDENPACGVAINDYLCLFVHGNLGVSCGCNGNANDARKYLPCRDDCFEIVRECFKPLKVDLGDLLSDTKYCLDLLGLNFCPFKLASKNIINFLSNERKICDLLGADNECINLQFKAKLRQNPVTPMDYALIALGVVAGLLVVASIIALIVRNSNVAAIGDDDSDLKSGMSQQSDGTRFGWSEDGRSEAMASASAASGASGPSRMSGGGSKGARKSGGSKGTRKSNATVVSEVSDASRPF